MNIKDALIQVHDEVEIRLTNLIVFGTTHPIMKEVKEDYLKTQVKDKRNKEIRGKKK